MAGVRFFPEGAGNKPAPYIARMASLLRSVAKYYCKEDQAVLKQLNLIARNLEKRGPRQMTDNYRELMRQQADNCARNDRCSWGYSSLILGSARAWHSSLLMWRPEARVSVPR